MEIQDRNSLLQLLFGAREAKTSRVSPEDGFADMLNPRSTEGGEEFVRDNGQSSIKEIKTQAAIKEKKDLPVKETKKKTAEDKQPVRSEDKKSKLSKNENKPKEEAGAAVVGNDNNAPKPEQKTMSDEGAVEADVSDTIENVAEEEVAGEVLSFDESMLLEGVMPVVSSGVAAEQVVEPGVAAAEILPVVEDARAQTVLQQDNETVVAEQIVTPEEALLFEQAEILDNKIAPSQKLKISVDVKEEKIAAPITKDVLQNRFEVDALLRQVVADSVVEDGAEVETVSIDKPVYGNTEPVVASGAEIDTVVAFAEAKQNFDTASRSVDAPELTVIGKETIVDAAAPAKGETFARLNETSSRDGVKVMGKEVVEQIKINITKSAVRGVDVIDIQLKPEDLGKIQIKMHISKDGRLQAEIISGRAETLDMLQKEISGLVKAFNDAGYDTDSRSFNFSFQDENQAREQQKEDSGFLQFIGDALEQEAENITGNDNLVYDPALGLNIRV